MKHSKKILIALTLIISVSVMATERRVYYLDVTASMTGYNSSENIWDTVTSNLKKAIKAIPDDDTEVVIKSFTDSNHSVTKIVSAKATEAGKKKICGEIDKINPAQNTNCHTDIFVPLEDFYKHEISLTKVDYFFLMTDGKQFASGINQLTSAINKWNDKTDNGKKHIYGFYVMLTEGATLSNDMERRITQQPHLWIVQTANVNINLVRPTKDDFICNIRNKGERFIDIPMSGNIESIGLSAKGSNEYIQVNKTEIKGQNLRVYFSLKKKHLSQIPKISTIDLTLTMPETNFTYLLSNQVTVHCDNLTPWAKIGIGIGSGILLLLLLWFMLIKPAKYRTFKKMRKQMLLQKNGKILEQRTIEFTGMRQVVFADKKVKQSFLNRLFTGKIVTYISPEITAPITIKPMRNRKDAYVNALGYTVTPNPMPKSGIATLENKEYGILITLN